MKRTAHPDGNLKGREAPVAPLTRHWADSRIQILFIGMRWGLGEKTEMGLSSPIIPCLHPSGVFPTADQNPPPKAARIRNSSHTRHTSEGSNKCRCAEVATTAVSAKPRSEPRRSLGWMPCAIDGLRRWFSLFPSSDRTGDVRRVGFTMLPLHLYSDSVKGYFTPFGIQDSNFATSDFAPELTGMPQKSKNGPRFLFTIFE